MDAADVELTLIRWNEAASADEQAAAGPAMEEVERCLLADLRDQLGKIEGQIPAIAEAVCSGLARVQDFPADARVWQCAQAFAHWTRNYPHPSSEFGEIRQRLITVLNTLTALDPASRWTPPAPDERTG